MLVGVLGGAATPAQCAELSRKCAAAQHAVFLHLAARLSLLGAPKETTPGDAKALPTKTLTGRLYKEA